MRFIVGYESTPSGIAALKLAKQHAVVWKAEVDIVCSVSRDEPIRHSRLIEEEAWLETEIHAFFSDTDIKYTVSLTTDNIDEGEQIVRFARRKKGDVIFIGVKKRSRVGKMLTGSTLQYVVLNAHCPVMTVKHEEGN